MSLVVPFLGENRIVFETPEKHWGPDTTANLVDLLKTGDFLFFRDDDDNLGIAIKSATLVVNDDDSITPTAPVMKLTSASGDVDFTLEDGVQDGQIIELFSADSGGNLLTLSSGANAQLNGDMVFDRYDNLILRWDEDEGLWIERGRST